MSRRGLLFKVSRCSRRMARDYGMFSSAMPAGRAGYSTTYPNARALSLTRESRVTTVISCGGSPSSSAVARCTASSVRIGSTGNGRHARASTASVTATTSQRRRNPCSQRSPARSSSAVKRPATRARTRAREASANVRAEVIRLRRLRNALRATVSCSRSAASKALVSMYLNVGAVALAASVADGRRVPRRAD